jgi:O-antigen ligase
VRVLARSLPSARTSLLLGAALAAALLIVRLPLASSAALFGGALLLFFSAWEPAAGIGLAIIVGPAKAYLAVAPLGLPSELGQVFFALAVAGWLARGLAGRRLIIPRLPLLIPLALYIGVAAFSLLAARSLEEGVKELFKWIEVGLVLVILAAETERGRGLWVLGAILLAGAGQAALGVWQFQFRTHGPEHFRILETHFRAYGTFEQPNPFAGFVGLIWPLCAGLALGLVSGPRRWTASRLLLAGLFAALAVFILASLYFSFSRGAWLGAAAAALALGVAWPRRLRVGLGLAAAALVGGWALSAAGLMPAAIAGRLAEVADFASIPDVRGININDTNFAILERLAHWQAAERMFAAHPWAGVGLGNYGVVYADYRLYNWEIPLGHAHNIYLNVLAETGIPGLVTYVILWASVIALTMRAVRTTAGWRRGLALGLCGAWAHLAVHQIVDNLYVDNTHFLIAGLLAMLIYLVPPVAPRAGRESAG